MPLIRARMIEQGEDFHISVFPGAFSLHTGPKLEEPDLEGRFFWGHTLTRAHAMEAGAFVLSACGYMTSGDLPPDFPLRETVNLDYAHGGSQRVPPEKAALQIRLFQLGTGVKRERPREDGDVKILSLLDHPTANERHKMLAANKASNA